METTNPVAKDSAHSSSRLSDWIPLDMKGKPLYAGINEEERKAAIRQRINAVRVKWNNPAQRHELSQKVEEALRASNFSRDLRAALGTVLAPSRFWADQQDEKSFAIDTLPGKKDAEENYGALEVYTTNDGYKNIFGYINQVFRKHDVDETEIQGAVALVELLTIDLYNLRLANFGCSVYYNFQGTVHRGLSVDKGVLDTFHRLLKEPVQARNFSVPLAFVSTSANQQRIQEFLDKTEQGKFRLHLKIHIHELEPRLLAQYHAKYPKSIVSTICAMPISRASEFPNEQEVLLRGPLFQIVRMYEEQSRDHTVHVVEMLMLNANRDHATELADHQGVNKQQRTHFAEICGATKYQICASLVEKYSLPEAAEYRNLANNLLKKLSSDHIEAPFSPNLSESWSVPRPSWIGASLESSFTKYYAKRRAKLSISSYEGKWDEVRKVLDEEYDWQKSDWCNVTRLYGTKEEAANASGFTVLHQAAYNNASLDFIEMLIACGAWRTLKSDKREGCLTAKEVAIRRGNQSIASILESKINHPIAAATLEKLEANLHALMMRLAGSYIERHAIRLPQLSVMTEMAEDMPSLWIPIPGMYGGFVIDMDPVTPCLHVLRVSNAYPKIETKHTVFVDE